MLQRFEEIPTEKKFLERKRQREDFRTSKANITRKTEILLIYISTIPFNSNDYSYIKFSFSDKINLTKLIKKKYQTLKFDINSNKIYIIDRVELGNEDESRKETFIASIYLKKKKYMVYKFKTKEKRLFL